MIALKASGFGTLHFALSRNPRLHQLPPQTNSRKCEAVCSIDGLQCSSTTPSPANNSSGNKKSKLNEEREDGGERKVHCEVEAISWRERRIKAEILVNADIESVWDALTDYERLADFIPNLVCR